MGQVCVDDEFVLPEKQCSEGKLHKDIADIIVVYIGLNDKDTNGIDGEDNSMFDDYKYKVKRVYVRKKWKGTMKDLLKMTVF